MRRFALGVAVLTLALSACEIRAEVEVNEDGSGTFGFMFGIEPLFFSGIPPAANPLTLAKRQLERDPLDWIITEIDEPSLKGFRAVTRFDDMQHFQDIQRALSENDELDLIQARPEIDESFVIQRAGTGWELRATATGPSLGEMGSLPGLEDLPEGVDPEALGLPDLTDGMSLGMPPEAESLLHFEFHVTLPGKATTSNAAETKRRGDKTTFIWRASAFQGERIDLRAATTEAGGASFPVAPAGALVAAGGAGFLVFRRRRPAAPPIVLEGMPVVEVPPPSPPGPGLEPAPVPNPEP